MKPTRYWLNHVDPPTFLAADDLAFTRAAILFVNEMDAAAALTSDPADLAAIAVEIAARVQRDIFAAPSAGRPPTIH